MFVLKLLEFREPVDDDQITSYGGKPPKTSTKSAKLISVLCITVVSF